MFFSANLLKKNQNFFLLFFKEAILRISCYSFSLAQRKRIKRDIHLLQTSPYMGRLNRSSCRSFIKVSSDRQRSGLSFLMKIDILPIFMVLASRSCSGSRAFALRASDDIFNAHFFSKRNEPKKILLSPNPFLHIKGLN